MLKKILVLSLGVLSLLASTCTDMPAPPTPEPGPTQPPAPTNNDFAVYVKAAYSGEKNTYQTIQEGIDAAKLLVPAAKAANKRAVVWVHEGDEFKGSGNLPIVTMAEGVDVIGQGTTNKPIINGQGKQNLVHSASDSTLRNFTLTKGKHSPSGASAGSAIFANNIHNSRFEQLDIVSNSNSAVFIEKSEVTISECQLMDNPESALYISTGPSTITITSSHFEKNNGQGGAIFSQNAKNVTININKCTFSENQGQGRTSPAAGAIALVNGTLNIAQTLFDKNQGAAGAISLFSTKTNIQTSLFANNKGQSFAGAIYLEYGSDAKITNVTFRNNSGIASGIGTNARSIGLLEANATITNSILWGKAEATTREIAGVHGLPFTVTVSHSDVQGGYAGDANIDADPQFVQPADSNYSNLEASSPCIGTGLQINPISITNFLGYVWPNAVLNIGAL